MSDSEPILQHVRRQVGELAADMHRRYPFQHYGEGVGATRLRQILTDAEAGQWPRALAALTELQQRRFELAQQDAAGEGLRERRADYYRRMEEWRREQAAGYGTHTLPSR